MRTTRVGTLDRTNHGFHHSRVHSNLGASGAERYSNTLGSRTNLAFLQKHLFQLALADAV